MSKEKKSPAKKAAPKAPEKPVEKAAPFTKAQIVAKLSEDVGLSKKDVALCVDALGGLIQAGLEEADSFTLPGLIKIEKQWIPEKEGKKNVPDPFHPGMTTDRPAKPAHWKVKIKALKALKDMAANFKPAK